MVGCKRNSLDYRVFMYNKENIYNCSECPENKKLGSYNGSNPCGSMNCWVQSNCCRE